MSGVEKVTITLDHNLLAAIERRRLATGQTRSEFFHHAAQQALQREEGDSEQ